MANVIASKTPSVNDELNDKYVTHFQCIGVHWALFEIGWNYIIYQYISITLQYIYYKNYGTMENKVFAVPLTQAPRLNAFLVKRKLHFYSKSVHSGSSVWKLF